eukprot:TRINITY_DN32507_c0_g1_i1.p1 TRINITY_DN32507_c0_g1~~TRINITY_DN32507_c0_g1_i1.p1  ORF type:complete len:607 (+),score=106.84 TRINITY_DN32507_c0_g1_i1:54-1823(+)
MATDGVMQATGREPPSIHPRNIVRSIIFVQNAVREKFLYRRLEKESGPSIALSCAFSFCHNLLRSTQHEIENEAMGVAALICGRDASPPQVWRSVRGLTLGAISATYEYYAPKLLSKDHPVLEMLVSRFGEVAVDVEDDVMARIQDAGLPSKARALANECYSAWGTPDVPPWGKPTDVIFPHVEEFIANLRSVAESVILTQLSRTETTAGFDSLAVAVNRELGEGFSPARKFVSDSAARHRGRMESAGQTMYGWPPVGGIPMLAIAARWFTLELGASNCVVLDFVAATVRELRRAEKKVSSELEPLETEVVRLRTLLGADPAPPKLLREGYEKTYDETFAAAMSAAMDWEDKLGFESDLFLRHYRGILGAGRFLEYLREEAATTAANLRRLGPPRDPLRILDETPETAADAETRMAAAARLSKLVQCLRDEGDAGQAETLEDEFVSLLKFAKPLVNLLHPSKEEEDEDDGWHRPPGFDDVEVAFVPPEPPAPEPPPPKRPPTPPQGEKKMKFRMRLHGVSLEDVRCNSELLLLEKLSDIVAAECGIPREWLGGVSVAPTTPGMAEVVPEIDKGDSTDRTDGSAGTSRIS